MLLAMAVTSTKGWIRRLGRNWVRLHRLVYAAGVLGVIHYLWATKADDRWPFVAALVLAALLGSRVWWAARRRLPKESAPSRKPRASEGSELAAQSPRGIA
jgi:sulfoxide reductase heme-binding subunit YedZ